MGKKQTHQYARGIIVIATSSSKSIAKYDSSSIDAIRSVISINFFFCFSILAIYTA